MIFEKVLDRRESPFNGEVTVVKSLSWGTFIQVGGITQSGGIVEKIWKDVVKKLKGNFNNILILGFGGGSVAKILRKRFKDAKITGVEIDRLMVEMGQKYLGVDELGVEIVVDDAYNFLIENNNRRFDLVIVDIYQGKNFPSKFESDDFLNLIGSVLLNKGTLVFNRLYTSDPITRKSAIKFGEKVEKKFPYVERIFPLANLIFVCKRYR